MDYLKVSWGARFFLAGLFVYACSGSPTPDTYGWSEALTAFFLLLAVRFPNLKRDGILLFCAAAGLFVPALIGAVRGFPFSDMIRDMVPFLFLFLVALYRPHIEELGNRFLWIVAGMGIVFSLRAVVPVAGFLLSTAPSQWGAPPDLLYLANSPEVLFAALWLLGSGFAFVFEENKTGRGLALFGLALFPLLSMAMMMQRAGIAAVGLYFLFLLLGLAVRNPKRFLLALFVTGGLAGLASPVIGPVAEALMWKTHVVGFNSRLQEWEKVIGLVGSGWGTTLVGYGWGMRFDNPAVGDVSVLYTHSLFSSLLLKTGFLGFFVVLSGIGVSLKGAFPPLFRKPTLFLAVIFPLLIGAGIYASYKSLGFGLVLLIFSGFPYQKLERNDPPVA